MTTTNKSKGFRDLKSPSTLSILEAFLFLNDVGPPRAEVHKRRRLFLT